MIEAEKEAQVAEIRFRQKIMEKESQQRIAEIENEIELARRKTQADAEHYASEQRARGNLLVFTPEFLEYKRIEALAGNTKVYFGDKIPPMFVQVGSSDGAAQHAGDGGEPGGARTASGNVQQRLVRRRTSGDQKDDDVPNLPEDFLKDVLGKVADS